MLADDTGKMVTLEKWTRHMGTEREREAEQCVAVQVSGASQAT
jgi:hypothetical protein